MSKELQLGTWKLEKQKEIRERKEKRINTVIKGSSTERFIRKLKEQERIVIIRKKI